LQALRKEGEMGMSESRPKKHKVEFIESYWTGGEFGSDYQWNDNHGELIRCKDCKHGEKCNSVYLCGKSRGFGIAHDPSWFCADGERNESR
jgi:hypothetical protein